MNQDCLDRQAVEPRKTKNLVLKTTHKLNIKKDDMTLLTRYFQRSIKKVDFLRKVAHPNLILLKKVIIMNATSVEKNYFIKDCPPWENKYKKNNPDKVRQYKKDWVSENRLTHKATDKLVKRTMTGMQTSHWWVRWW